MIPEKSLLAKVFGCLFVSRNPAAYPEQNGKNRLVKPPEYRLRF
jgi:hypothetical protein